jgi:tRNA (adenine22-N1)-methyltransferase
MILSKRLNCIARHIEHEDCVADIGTDHGYLPIALVKQGRAARVIAMDLRKQPLLRAQSNIRDAGVENQITLRLSDGAEQLLPGEASVINISGMGGELMGRILATKPEVFHSAKQLYLSPQSEIAAFRKQLMEMGFHITDEWMVEEDGKYYFIMQAASGTETKAYTACELHFGRHLLQKQDPVLYTYLQREKHIQERVLARLEVVQSDNALLRRRGVDARLGLIGEACAYYHQKL